MSRSVTGNWTLNPMSNPDRLRAMRAAYHIALGSEHIDPLDAKKLDGVLKDQKELVIPRGWICAGTRHQVPHGACIVAHCGKTYVWVLPGHSKDFADFSLLMLNIATWVPPVEKAKVKAGPTPSRAAAAGRRGRGRVRHPDAALRGLDRLQPRPLLRPAVSRLIPARALPDDGRRRRLVDDQAKDIRPGVMAGDVEVELRRGRSRRGRSRP